MQMQQKLVNEIIQWDVKSWSTALNFWEQSVDWDHVENCLELGGREGGLSLWLALKNKKVVCSDVYDVRTTASRLHSKYEVPDVIDYEDINASSIPYEEHFDIIVFKSILGVIGKNNNKQEQVKVIDQIYKALKPGGKLLFAENLTGSPMHRYLRNRYVPWGNSWRYVTIQEVKSFLKQFKTYQVKTTGVISLLGRSESQRNTLASIDKLLLNHILPDHWKYIVYGIAEK
jgi:SAM-dependent methyltransferase